MKLKSKSVKIENLCFELKSKLQDIEKACKLYNGQVYTMIITSGNDSVHMKGSKHYINAAIDIRSNDMKQISNTVTAIKLVLGKNYDIIFERNHIHIEFDAKH